MKSILLLKVRLITFQLEVTMTKILQYTKMSIEGTKLIRANFSIRIMFDQILLLKDILFPFSYFNIYVNANLKRAGHSNINLMPFPSKFEVINV